MKILFTHKKVKMAAKIESEFSFQKPSIYKIKVEGILKASWSEKLQGLQINVQRSPGEKPISILIGKIDDQSALSGLLNTLYDFNLTIISVQMLKSK